MTLIKKSFENTQQISEELDCLVTLQSTSGTYPSIIPHLDVWVTLASVPMPRTL